MAIKCCEHCVPPKRHEACWGHCPDYAADRAVYDGHKAEDDKKRKARNDIYNSRSTKVIRALRKHR